MGAVLTELLELAEDIGVFLPKLVPGFIVFLIFWMIGSLAKKIALIIGSRLSTMKRELADLAGQTVKSVFIITGAVLALSKIGININALVASLGLTGFALGFAGRAYRSRGGYSPGDCLRVNC